MAKKIIFIVVGVLLVLLAVFSGIIFQGREERQVVEDAIDQAIPVNVIEVQQKDIHLFIELQGRLQAEETIELFAEVSGILLRTDPPFRVGNVFSRNQILINIDSREQRQELISQRSNFLSSLTQLLPDIRLDFTQSYEQWVTYVEQFDPERQMPELPEAQSSQERYFLTGRNIYSQYHTIRQMEIRATKFQIRAPFDGSVTESNINPGALVRSGQPLGRFAKLNEYEMVATARVDDLQFMDIGDEVNLRSGTLEGNWRGTVVRISDIVDPATQMVNVFINTKGEDLREGMFLSGTVRAGMVPKAVKLPREILNENNEVFIIKDSLARLLEVRLRSVQNDSVIVQGLEDNTLVINERRNPNFEGTEVRPENGSQGKQLVGSH
jgi:membrane fusion protein, multidrug efflux system